MYFYYHFIYYYNESNTTPQHLYKFHIDKKNYFHKDKLICDYFDFQVKKKFK